MKHFRPFVVVVVWSVLFVPMQASFAADKETRGAERADSAAIRQHPGGLIQAEWLQHRAITDDQGGRSEESGQQPAASPETGPKR